MALYLINKTILNEVNAEFIGMFEKIATTAVTWTLEGDELVLRVLKAADPELMEKEHRAELKELLQGSEGGLTFLTSSFHHYR